MRKTLLVLFLALAAACTPRGTIEAIFNVPPDSGATPYDIHVVTTRQPLTAPPFFGPARGADVQYSRFGVTVPDNRDTGEVTWRHETAVDPSSQFLTTDHAILGSAQEMSQSLRAGLQDRDLETREIVLFVHGYNTNFAEALYRLAQVAHDFDVPGKPVLFSWPSAGDPRGYLYDRDSVLIARDALADTIQRLNTASRGRLTIVSFSMGGFLTVEALRQLALTGDRRTIDRLQGAIFISPDIDVDLFARQAQTIAPLPDPMVVMASRNDAALGVSALLTNQEARLGSLPSLEGLEDLGIILIDITDFDGDAENSHSVGLTSPSLIRILRGASEAQEALAPVFEAGSGRRSREITPEDIAAGLDGAR